MSRVSARRPRARRRVLLLVLAGLAAGSFALGVALAAGGGESTSAPPAEVVATLPVGQLAGERIVVGLRGTDVSPRLRTAIHAGRVAGVVLFAANFPSRVAGRRMIRRLQAIPRPPALRDPLLILVDQEGGEVKRVGGAPSASAEEMGARGAAFSARQGRLTAANLRDLGVNVDLAPVLDVARPGGVIAETERAFGMTAKQVRDTAIPFAEALQAAGVAATAKHFPGFGAARENTDFAVERIDLSRAELRGVDEAPYPAFIDSGGKLVMLSTAIYPAFSERPAAFSRKLATGELRERLGFAGVTITDALETAAVKDFGGPRKAGAAAVRAGADLLLFVDQDGAEQAWRGLVEKLRAGALDRGEFEAAAQRVLDLRADLGR
jgi:beta-N-acetylhexosaminidase